MVSKIWYVRIIVLFLYLMTNDLLQVVEIV